jgi:hypothetical protein
MKIHPLWRVLLLLVLASLACTFGGGGSTLPPTNTPAPPRPTQAEPEPTAVTDPNLDQDLNLGGLGGDNDDNNNQDDDDLNNQGCSRFAATSSVSWVTLDEDFNIEEQVSSYPRGATLITPLFEYNCVPQRLSIVSVFSYEDDVVYSDQENLNASTAPGLYGYPLGTTDNSALSDGSWGVEFYVNDQLIAGGAVTVGGGGGQTNTNELVTVGGTVVAAASGRPIAKALILFLVPGISVQDFIDHEYADADVYTGAETNSRGQFTLADAVERNVPYSIIVVADGYKPLTVDGFVIEDDVPAPVNLDIELAQ